jgi:hypothetical protein
VGIWLFVVIAVGVAAYRFGVRSGLARGLEQGWQRDDRELVDRLRRSSGVNPADEGPGIGE